MRPNHSLEPTPVDTAPPSSSRPFKIQTFEMFILLIIFAALVSGCATSRDSQQSAAPTVGGYISTGAEKNF